MLPGKFLFERANRTALRLAQGHGGYRVTSVQPSSKTNGSKNTAGIDLKTKCGGMTPDMGSLLTQQVAIGWRSARIYNARRPNIAGRRKKASLNSRLKQLSGWKKSSASS